MFADRAFQSGFWGLYLVVLIGVLAATA